MAHVAESAHWYDREGRPVYEIDGKPTTLRHARKLNLLPGCTSIMRCAYSYNLELYKIKQAMMAALTLPRVDGETDDAFIDRVLKDSREDAAQAADRGTQIHAALEAFYSGEPFDPEMEQHVVKVREAILNAMGEQNWKAEKAIACRAGFGTKSDLCSDDWMIDFKGTEKPQDKLALYDSHFQQLAATRHALRCHAVRHSEPVLYGRTRCAIVYVHRDTAETTILEAKEVELQKGLDMFLCLLKYWQIDKNFNTAF